MKHILLASIAAAALLGGCASILDRIGEDDIAKLDALADEWIAKLEAKLAEPSEPDKPAPETPAPETPADPAPAVDQVDFALLKWQYGGFNGAGAVPSAGGARIADLKVTEASPGGKLSFRWERTMKAWGFGDADICAVCAVFFKGSDGVWRGGKFDHISTSRTSRDLKHCASYKDWTMAGVPKDAPVAFVIVQYDGKRRTNVIVKGAK